MNDFFFVWVLLALLVLYIVSISERSNGYSLFAGGNLVVEIVLTIYVMREGRPSKESVS